MPPWRYPGPLAWTVPVFALPMHSEERWLGGAGAWDGVVSSWPPALADGVLDQGARGPSRFHMKPRGPWIKFGDAGQRRSPDRQPRVRGWLLWLGTFVDGKDYGDSRNVPLKRNRPASCSCPYDAYYLR